MEKHDLEETQAINDEEGIEKAKIEVPDVIIMDWQLPDIDGIEVTKQLRAIDALKNIPIIFCTSNVLAGDQKKAYAAGATGYIEKPLDPDTFMEEVKKFLK